MSDMNVFCPWLMGLYEGHRAADQQRHERPVSPVALELGGSQDLRTGFDPRDFGFGKHPREHDIRDQQASQVRPRPCRQRLPVGQRCVGR